MKILKKIAITAVGAFIGVGGGLLGIFAVIAAIIIGGLISEKIQH